MSMDVNADIEKARQDAKKNLYGGTMNEYKSFNVKMLVRARTELDDPQATDETVRYLLEEDLRCAGWDADVFLIDD